MALATVAIVFALALCINLETPYLGYATASAFLFHVRARRGWKELLAALLMAAALGALRLHFIGIPADAAGFKGAMIGLGSVMVLGVRAPFATGTERNRLLAVLTPALGLMFFMFTAQRTLSLGESLYPKTFDLYLYAFDGSFGFQPSFALGRLFHQSVLFRDIGFLTYQTLPLFMALVYAGYIDPRATKPAWYLLELFLAAGLLGVIFYNFLPAAGPAYAFLGTFPNAIAPLHTPLPRLSVASVYARNAMPSMHMTWALLAYWSCRRFPLRARAASFVYVVLTAIATLGTGEHYLIDLVVAVPFALMVEALCKRSIPFANRRLPMLAGLILTVGWLLLVRFGLAAALISPAIPWALAVVSTGLSLHMERRLA